MHSMDVQVTMIQVGPDGLMRPYDILAIMQDCSLQWLETEPVMRDWMRDNGIIMVVTSRQVDIVRAPRYGEKLTVRTSVYAARSFLGYRNTFVYDEQGACVAKCWCVGAWVSQEGKAIRVPNEVVDSLTIEPELDIEKLPHRIKLKGVEPQVGESYVVRRSDTDLFGHMNNTRYVRFAWDLLPEDFQVNRFRAEYKAQARPGDLIVPKCYQLEGSTAFSLQAPDGTEYCVVDFS